MALHPRAINSFRNGRTLIVPIDHGTFIPVPGLERTGDLIAQLANHADGFIANLGVVKAHRQRFGSKAVWLRCDVYRSHLCGEGPLNMYHGYSAPEALAVDATGLIAMCFPGNPHEREITGNCTFLVSQGIQADMPVMLESVPYGLGVQDHYTPEKVGFATRLAAELGADVVKTAWPGSADAFAKIVEETPVPVVLLGGARFDTRQDIFEIVAASIRAGGAGVAIGRNVWQDDNPLAMTKALEAIIHNGASAEEAAEIHAEG